MFVTYRKKSLIIKWPSLAAKTEKCFTSEEKEFYRIGHRSIRGTFTEHSFREKSFQRTLEFLLHLILFKKNIISERKFLHETKKSSNLKLD